MTEEQFKIALQYGKRLDKANDQEIIITELPFAFIKWEFSQFIQKGDIKSAVEKALEYLKIDSKLLNYKEIVSIFLYLYDEILTEKGLVFQLEKKYLSSLPDPLMIASGQSRLAPYNTHLTLYNLTNGDITKEDEVSMMSYGRLLDRQVMLKIKGEVESKYQELVINKNKK